MSIYFFDLELQTCFACAFSQVLYTAMIQVATTIENNNLQSQLFCLTAKGLTYQFAFFRLRSFLRHDIFILAGSRSQRYACHVIDQLRIYIRVASEDCQPGLLRRAGYFMTDPVTDLLSSYEFRCHCSLFYTPDTARSQFLNLLTSSFTSLTTDLLAFVFNTLSFVGLGLT